MTRDIFLGFKFAVFIRTRDHASYPSLPAEFSRPFDAHESSEIVPLKKGLHVTKAVSSEHLDVFVDSVRDEYVFQGLSLPGELGLGVTVSPLEFVVAIDHEAIHTRAFRKNLFGHYQCPVLDHSVMNPSN